MRGITEFTPLKGKNSPVKSIKSRETEQVRVFSGIDVVSSGDSTVEYTA